MPESLQSLQSHCGDEVHEWQEEKKRREIINVGFWVMFTETFKKNLRLCNYFCTQIAVLVYPNTTEHQNRSQP